MKLLVIGAGSIGARHAANAAPLAETAVVDLDAARAQRAAEAAGVRWFADLESSLAWKPEAVIVATPTDRHLEPASAAIEAGAHVLVEKPIAARLDGVAALLAKAESHGRKLFVGCNMRFHPAVKALRQGLAAAGRPLTARAYFGHYLPNMRPNVDYRTVYAAHAAQGGGVILDCIHEIDYLAWLFGPVVAVTAAAGHLSDLEIAADDFAVLVLRHDSGVVSILHLDYMQRLKRRGCEIVGSQATLLWESEGKQPERCVVRALETARTAILYESADLPGNEPYVEELRAFLAAIEGASAPLLDGATATAELAVALAAQESARSGRTVEIEPRTAMSASARAAKAK